MPKHVGLPEAQTGSSTMYCTQYASHSLPAALRRAAFFSTRIDRPLRLVANRRHLQPALPMPRADIMQTDALNHVRLASTNPTRSSDSQSLSSHPIAQAAGSGSQTPRPESRDPLPRQTHQLQPPKTPPRSPSPWPTPTSKISDEPVSNSCANRAVVAAEVEAKEARVPNKMHRDNAKPTNAPPS